jgi:hypothetical protein
MDISTILKFAGILVAGALGILGTVTETRNKKTGRLTTWGKTALWLTVAGLTLALGAQLFDSLNQKHEENESRKRTGELLNQLTEQGQIAQESLDKIKYSGAFTLATLDQIERIVNPIEDVIDTFRFDIPSFGFDLKSLANTNEKAILLDLTKNRHSPTPTFTQQRNGPIYSGNIVAYSASKDGNVTTTTIVDSSEGLNIAEPISLDTLEQMHVRAKERGQEQQRLLDFMHSPKTTIRIWRDSFAIQPDFVATTKSDIHIVYLLPSERFRVTLTSDYPKSSWIHNASIKSLPDLSKAYFSVILDNYPTNQSSPAITNSTDHLLFGSTNELREICPISCDFSVNEVSIPTTDLGFPPMNSIGILAQCSDKNSYLFLNLRDYAKQMGVKPPKPPPVGSSVSSAGPPSNK